MGGVCVRIVLSRLVCVCMFVCVICFPLKRSQVNWLLAHEPCHNPTPAITKQKKEKIDLAYQPHPYHTVRRFASFSLPLIWAPFPYTATSKYPVHQVAKMPLQYNSPPRAADHQAESHSNQSIQRQPPLAPAAPVEPTKEGVN